MGVRFCQNIVTAKNPFVIYIFWGFMAKSVYPTVLSVIESVWISPVQSLELCLNTSIPLNEDSQTELTTLVFWSLSLWSCLQLYSCVFFFSSRDRNTRMKYLSDTINTGPRVKNRCIVRANVAETTVTEYRRSRVKSISMLVLVLRVSSEEARAVYLRVVRMTRGKQNLNDCMK